MNKIIKFFEHNNFRYNNTTETKRYHIGHSKSDCLANIINVEIKGNNYLFENPLSGTKTYYLTDLGGKVLCDGRILTLGFTQEQFIENLREYFKI